MGNLAIKRKSIKSEGSCNFCKRGIQNEASSGLAYPYKEVVAVQGNYNCSLSVRFCDRCLREVNEYLNATGA